MKKASVLIVILLTTVSFSFAHNTKNEQGPGSTHCDGSGVKKNQGHGLHQIPNLTEDQANQIQKIRLVNRKKKIELQSDIKILELELEEMLTVDANKGKMDATIEKISKLRGEIMKNRLQTHLAVMDVLTDEQKKFFTFNIRNKRWGQGKHCGLSNNGKGHGGKECHKTDW